MVKNVPALYENLIVMQLVLLHSCYIALCRKLKLGLHHRVLRNSNSTGMHQMFWGVKTSWQSRQNSSVVGFHHLSSQGGLQSQIKIWLELVSYKESYSCFKKKIFNAGVVVYFLNTVHLVIIRSKHVVCFLKNIEID
jgi:hypothetical protein